jgi:hypothetical protein
MIVVWFSCGAASAAALKLTVERYPEETVRAINFPIAEEHHDNRRFLLDVEKWTGVKIETYTAKRYPTASAVDVWEHRRAMSFPHGAPCTVHLKKEARQEWCAEHRPDWHVLGFTVEEKDRHQRFIETEVSNVLPVLIDAHASKIGCADMLRFDGIRLPKIYDHGFPNANCIGCVKATSPTYWNLVRRDFPEVFAKRAEQSRRLNVKLARVKGERVFLDELDPDATGRPLKSLPDCGIFCEEEPR